MNSIDSLFCAKEWFKDDLIITFSDIIYDTSILKKMINSNYNFTCSYSKKMEKKNMKIDLITLFSKLIKFMLKKITFVTSEKNYQFLKLMENFWE